MIGLPVEPRRGQRITADAVAQVIRYVKSTAPRSTPGSYSIVGSGGSTRRPIARAKWQWPQSIPPPATWPFMVYDASVGATPQFSVKPGAFNGSVIPTLGGTAINTPTGSPPAWPVQAISAGTSYCWFQLNYDDTNSLTSVTIQCGAGIPAPNPSPIVPGMAGYDICGLSTLIATVTSGASPKASVQCLNDFVSGNLFYSQCGNQSYFGSM